jgi:hypothetical protein
MKTNDLRPRLERRRAELARVLRAPETFLRASVFTRTRRCGGATCRCAKGKGHTTAYLATNHPGGKTEQISLPPDLVPEARRWVAASRRWWRSAEKISAINLELFRRRWIEPSKPRAAGRRA